MHIDDYAQNPRFRYSILQVNDTPFEQSKEILSYVVEEVSMFF